MRKLYIAVVIGVIAFGLAGCAVTEGPLVVSGSTPPVGVGTPSTASSGTTDSPSPDQGEPGDGAASSAPSSAASAPEGQATEPGVPAESVFPSPSVALTDSQTVVPNIVGLASEKAFGALMASYLSARVTQQASDTVAADLVVSVSPSPGTIIDKGSQVMVVVSAGPVAESSST